MKIVLMSDNHGRDEDIIKVKELEPDADIYVHCGDSQAFDASLLQGFKAVKGNNDWFLDLPEELVFTCEGWRILVLHGHRSQGLLNKVDYLNVQLVFCGHSHVPCHQVIDGIHIINPGSTFLPRNGSPCSYGVVELEGDSIKVVHKSIVDGQKIF